MAQIYHSATIKQHLSGLKVPAANINFETQ